MTTINQWDGSKLSSTTVDGDALGQSGEGGRPKRRLMRSAVLQYEANKRQGTVKTKTRAETAYTENKPYRQKGTGNARRGDRNSPLLVGGGITFGPRPRSYRQRMPRKALREALRSALLGKLGDEQVVGVGGKVFGEPSTKTAAAAMAALGVGGSACVVTPALNEIVWKSFRNLPRVVIRRAEDLNAYDVLAHDHLILVDDAWATLQSRLAGDKEGSK